MAQGIIAILLRVAMACCHSRCSSSSSWEHGPPKPNRKRVWFPEDCGFVHYFYDHPSACDSRKSVPVKIHIECPYRSFWKRCYQAQVLKTLKFTGESFMDTDLFQDDLWWSCLRRNYDNMVTEYHMRTFNCQSSSCSRKRSQVWCPFSQSFVEMTEIWNEMWMEPSNEPYFPIHLPVIHEVKRRRRRT